jgi:MOSC domain-containing protein YiiM
MSTPVVLASIQVAEPRTFGIEGATDLFEKPWTTGIYKVPVTGPVHLGRTSLSGDGQADLVNHGGADKAVCAYCGDHYDEWRRLPGLPSMTPGAFGENFTLQGLDEASVCIGDVWSAGEVLLQVSQPRQPCWKLARKWGIRDFADQVIRSGRTGWYFRVLREGWIAPGTLLTLEERTAPGWTIVDANRVMHGRPVSVDASAALAAVSTLSASWRTTLLKRTAVQKS